VIGLGIGHRARCASARSGECFVLTTVMDLPASSRKPQRAIPAASPFLCWCTRWWRGLGLAQPHPSPALAQTRPSVAPAAARGGCPTAAISSTSSSSSATCRFLALLQGKDATHRCTRQARCSGRRPPPSGDPSSPTTTWVLGGPSKFGRILTAAERAICDRARAPRTAPAAGAGTGGGGNILRAGAVGAEEAGGWHDR